jgi:hypothetical protein
VSADETPQGLFSVPDAPHDHAAGPVASIPRSLPWLAWQTAQRPTLSADPIKR